MKISVFTILFNDWSLDDTLNYVSKMGVEAAEIGVGGYSKSNHCEPEEIISSKIKLEEFKDKFKDTFKAAQGSGQGNRHKLRPKPFILAGNGAFGNHT